MDSPELRALLRNLVLPPTGPLLLALLGMILIRLRRFPKTGWTLLVAPLAALWLLSTPLISGQLVRWLADYPALDLRRMPDAQAVVILGAGVQRYAPEYAGPALKPLTLERLTYGARVARLTQLPVLVTGRTPEADTMAYILRHDFHLPPRWIEQRAGNTEENARYSATILKQAGIERVVLVTSALHMRRSVSEFEANGIAVVPAPVDVPVKPQFALSNLMPGLAALQESHYVLYEVLGDIVRRIRAIF